MLTSGGRPQSETLRRPWGQRLFTLARAETLHKAHLPATREGLMTVHAKRLLEDRGNLPKFKLLGRIVRNGNLAQEDCGVDCSEVYSPHASPSWPVTSACKPGVP